ncbi:MAG: helix-turn-helix transcriptional regulator [Saprospiraceae bacterium]|nr:helix-turn-helix transcriptional regulator [Saprospiraceae bacterium]
MEQNQIDQSIRLKKLIKALDLNQSTFAKSLGLAQPNISRMINGGSNISVEVLNRLAVRFMQVNLHWLLTGNGEMFLDETESKSPKVNEESYVKGKGRLEVLEERLERLEEVVRRLVKDFEK